MYTPSSDSFRTNLPRAAVIALFMAVSAVIVMSAWLADDSYLTFRTVDNLVKGFGPTWNTDERVQIFTHPLWMLLISALYAVTGEIFYTPMIVSIVISIAAMWLLVRSSRESRSAIIALTVLLFSKAFADWSTSGLENPLTHLILGLFFALYIRESDEEPKTTSLCVVAGLALLNRMDTILLFLPALALSLRRVPFRKAAGAAAIGIIPFFLWEVFSLIYYGFPFPNTAYAKLGTGLSHLALFGKGVNYLLNSASWDPVSLTAITAAVILSLRRGSRPLAVLMAGPLLYLAYVVWIGGDFMSGRFISAPLYASALVIAAGTPRMKNAYFFISLAAIAVLGMLAPHPTILTGPMYGTRHKVQIVKETGIADERSVYYMFTGLMSGPREGGYPNHLNVPKGEYYSKFRGIVVQHDTNGFFSFYAGPYVHVLDVYALGDPLLARLPSLPGTRIGHFRRKIPEGYEETLKTGNNVIANPDLARYYDMLSLVTRGKIFDMKRFRTIIELNLGMHNDLINSYIASTEK